jgi:hypothetical protein
MRSHATASPLSPRCPLVRTVSPPNPVVGRLCSTRRAAARFQLRCVPTAPPRVPTVGHGDHLGARFFGGPLSHSPPGPAPVPLGQPHADKPPPRPAHGSRHAVRARPLTRARQRTRAVFFRPCSVCQQATRLPILPPRVVRQTFFSSTLSRRAPCFSPSRAHHRRHTPAAASPCVQVPEGLPVEAQLTVPTAPPSLHRSSAALVARRRRTRPLGEQAADAVPSSSLCRGAISSPSCFSRSTPEQVPTSPPVPSSKRRRAQVRSAFLVAVSF